MPGLRKDFDDEEGPPAFAPVSRRKKGSRLAITIGDGADSADSMPGLQSVSNTDDEDDDEDEDDDDDDEEDEDDYEDNDRDVSYDAEIEDEIREMVDEAKFIARYAGDNIPSDIDPFLQEDRKGNPFLKLLGSLRGSSQ